MRIRRLDLLAYGHFTDAKLELPTRKPDLHMIFGLNEAGKSTALAAIEDLLFGITHNTQYGFAHEYGSMRLGAALDDTGKILEFRRRKGNRDTLLNVDGLPLSGGESALTPYLNGADRAFYSRMFCLDHERLRDGGREILRAHDDVGQILFSAGAGVVGLKDRVAQLREDADSLWANRRAAHRKYYQADDRLQQAENALRDENVSAKRWQELKTALEQANERYSTLEKDIEIKATDARKLGRIRRIYRGVQRISEITERLEQLAASPELPEDAGKLLLEALDNESQAKTRIKLLSDQIATFHDERWNLKFDEAIIARADDIKRLHELRIRTRDQKADLPKRRIELALAEDNLKRLAEEVGWNSGAPDEILTRLPGRSKVAEARSLSQRRAGLAAAAENAKIAWQEAEGRVSELTQEIEQEGALRDIAPLAAVIKAIKAGGDYEAKIGAAESEAQTAASTITTLLRPMRPTIPAECDIASLPVPPPDSVKHYRDRYRDLENRLHTCRGQIHDAELDTIRREKEYQRVKDDQHAIPAEELSDLRGHRDAGWSLIRRKYVEGADISEAEVTAFDPTAPLPEAYEGAVERADIAADRRFETAKATAHLAEIARQIAEQQERLEVLRGQLAAYISEETKLGDEWIAMWGPTSIVPLSPDEMLVWLDARSQIFQQLQLKASAERKVASLKEEQSKARARLLPEIVALEPDVASLNGHPLSVLIELAENMHRRHEAKAANRRKLEQSLGKATTESAAKLKSVLESENALKGATNAWSTAVAALGLDPISSPESIDAQIEIIGEMRDTANRINDLRHERVEKIERDIASFEAEVGQLIPAVASHLEGTSAEDAVLKLEELLQQSEQARNAAATLEERIAAEQKKINDCDLERLAAQRVVQSLQMQAGVGTVEDLKTAIDHSNERRSLRHDREEAEKAVLEDGDGLPLNELVDECKSANLDQIAARQQTIEADLDELRNQQVQAGQARAAAQAAFDAIGGDDRMARAAADRQSALAEIRGIAEDYIRLRSAELLLQHAIERYRREKQGPLLTRAGQLFAILTGGSFKGLRVEFDQADNMEIVGIRPSGHTVSVSGMTGGTVDQLYLALRVAAVEDYLSRSRPLPFIADDLFVNFDDKRAAAGFKVLGELAQKTQVLFFTHHRHLIEVADTALETNVSAIDLASMSQVNEGVAALAATA